MGKKLLALAFILAFVLAAGVALSQEHPKQAPQTPAPPVAKTEEQVYTISIIDVGQAVGVGPIWGQGVITYGDKTHLFKVKGFEKFAVGREKKRVNGDVYHLKKLEDLAGKYKKADPAGLTFIKGKVDLTIQNEKGVVINLKGKEHGLDLDLTKDGLHIKDIRY